MHDPGGVPYARFDAFDGTGVGWELAGLVDVCEARRIEEVEPALRAVEAAVAEGRHAAGYVAYEAAPGLDGSLTTHAPRSDLPLVWFGIFAERRPVHPPPPPAEAARGITAPWHPALDPAEHAARVSAIREWIAAGDTYQVNLTFPLRADAPATDAELYAALGSAQRAAYCALLRLPRVSVVSASPELFFRWTGRELELRPMKGTRPRGRWLEEDRERAAELAGSAKDRAENLMIVDLLRNDAGRVAEFGSVEVARLVEVESYPTVLQLTSSIRARTREGTTLADLFRALFPCGSVTGAPKVRTMQIIRALEDAPRGVYAGAVGLVSPGEAVFNVPIRTLLLDRESGRMEMGVGSGITWDSDAAAEYAECLQKAAFTRHRPPTFSLLETMAYHPAEGVRYREEHLGRMAASAAYFGYPMDAAGVERALDEALLGAEGARRVRLLLDAGGAIRVETAPLGETPRVLRARLAARPVDSADPLLQHKTSWRAPYEERLAEVPGYDEVLLVNERGELTEFANGNLVVRLGGVDWTPPRDCGLLPGVLRQVLLRTGEVRERVLRAEDLQNAEEVYRINSVRGWTRVVFPEAEGRPVPRGT
ncbi:MAG TPA: aminodeoxychorismate synthase component I [Longimicrobiaceae bacterium]